MRCSQANAGLAFLLALGLLVGPVVAWAQGLGVAPEESVPGSPSHETRTFGTPSVSHTLQAFAFTGDAANSAVYGSNSFRSRFCSSGTFCSFDAAVVLPAGALVTVIQLEACDTSTSGQVTVSLEQIGVLESGSQVLALTATDGSSKTPGCALFNAPLAAPHTIDNANNTYVIHVLIASTTLALDSASRFQAVRIFYNLQVRPAPATATFNDVPTSHAFFRFIEALRAAGITGGCSASPPLYCPDDPVTRGQMAVFLGRALGLQFAP